MYSPDGSKRVWRALAVSLLAGAASFAGVQRCCRCHQSTAAFAKVEADRGGLAGAFAAAIEGEIPVLTAVSPKFMDAWTRFADPLFEVLPPEAEAIEAWWRALRPEFRTSSEGRRPEATAAR